MVIEAEAVADEARPIVLAVAAFILECRTLAGSAFRHAFECHSQGRLQLDPPSPPRGRALMDAESTSVTFDMSRLCHAPRVQLFGTLDQRWRVFRSGPRGYGLRGDTGRDASTGARLSCRSEGKSQTHRSRHHSGHRVLEARSTPTLTSRRRRHGCKRVPFSSAGPHAPAPPLAFRLSRSPRVACSYRLAVPRRDT